MYLFVHLNHPSVQCAGDSVLVISVVGWLGSSWPGQCWTLSNWGLIEPLPWADNRTLASQWPHVQRVTLPRPSTPAPPPATPSSHSQRAIFRRKSDVKVKELIQRIILVKYVLFNVSINLTLSCAAAAACVMVNDEVIQGEVINCATYAVRAVFS